MASTIGRLHPHRHYYLHKRVWSQVQQDHQLEADNLPFATVPSEPSPVELAKRSTGSCSASESNCETTSGSSITVPVVIGVIVPVTIALILFIYFHRRHLKRLRAEDANEQHRSLDFGFDPALSQHKKGKKQGKVGAPEMTGTSDFEKSLRRPHGLSMDMGLGNPYMLPPEMQGSRESLHSLTRSLGHGTHDPYRPATFADSPRTLPVSKRGDDNESTRTGSTGKGFRQDAMNHNLLRHASRVSQSDPPPSSSSIIELPDPDLPTSPTAQSVQSIPATTLKRELLVKSPAAFSAAELDANPRQSTASHNVNLIRRSNNYLANVIRSREASVEGRSATASPDMQPRVLSPPADHLEVPPPRSASLAPNQSPIPQISIEHEFPGSSTLEYTEIVVPPPPDAASRAPGGTNRSAADVTSPGSDASTPFFTPREEHSENPMAHGLGVTDLDFDQPGNRLSIVRPLPPEDPTDTAEQRANRIRSFYKEYFNDTEAYAYAPGAGDYYEDYGSEYLGEAAIFDPTTNQFVVAQAPYAAPITRRAMTPPPRGPPRFQGAGRHGYTGSNPGSMMPRGRAFSTVSAGMGPHGPGARGRPTKRLPPPKALRTLPTPHLLKEDAFALPIDFAPPPRFKEQAAGRPQSPFSELRPYSPGVAVATPLKSSFAELSAMPSPHALRRSGTFTALDFAPPPKIRDREGASDAGSIRSGRSNRSAMSAQQVHNIRAGAYRLSRVPIDLVGSKNDFASALKPTWKVGSN